MNSSWVTINLDKSALEHNLSRVKEYAPAAKVLAMIKANAYGHGLIETADALTNADAFGVARLPTAIELRHAGFTQPIVLMAGVLSEDELALALEHELTLVVHTHYQLDLLEQAKASYPLWLKIDTGMGRLGFLPEEFPEALKRAEAITKDLVLFSHLANADQPDHPRNQAQIDLFLALTKDLPYPRSLANSAGLIALPGIHFDWLRPGIMLYGASPLENQSAKSLGLKPAMSLYARVIVIKTLKTGDYVGYGSRYRCDKETTVAVLGVGYGDGLSRVLDEAAHVMILGQVCPIIGRVSMDLITVDITGCNVKIGDAAMFWGEGLDVAEMAASANTIAYEILVHVSPRLAI
ncbi:MAG: alanine racemase [Gammaproteobacteria bacterium CG11_big_fil_rev_8_21_14_0_20_46_22]|nr:MAG: alanine racemase [Gammaproteobacteria bacterium CG12_big_fil_rev_8_21_14_0_65_46_12]PIR10339.1 MAG: alanine racemase [Gammaproteobacteria bacterium CG11_big_fil_rev_8_21_14_0_20_46_22]